MQFCTTERPQLFEFEVATCRTFWKLPRLICKNDEALCKAGSLHANLTPPNKTYLVFVTEKANIGCSPEWIYITSSFFNSQNNFWTNFKDFGSLFGFAGLSAVACLLCVHQAKNAIPRCRLLKVRVFWEGHKILRNLHLTFVYSTYRQK